MATIVKKQRKSDTVFQAIIRKKGYKPIKRTFDTKGQAKNWAAQQESLIYAKKYKDPRLAESVTLLHALTKYQEYEPVIRSKKDSTLARETYSKNNLLRLLGEHTPLSDITTSVVADYQDRRLKEPKHSTSSIRQELSMLSKMYRIAKIEWGLPVENPTEGVTRVSPPEGRERFLTTEEAIFIIQEAQACKNKRFLPYVLLLLHTGMRSGEAAKLTSDKIDLEKRTIIIKETKSGKPRKVALTIRATDALKAINPHENGYYFLQPQQLINEKFMEQPGKVFQTCWRGLRARLASKNQNQENLEEFKDFPYIKHFKTHDLRHTAGSHLLAAGVDIRVITDILGHATLQMVMRYTHIFEDTKTETIDKLNHLGFEEKP